ncbi:MAG: hypothetical protein C4297_08345 [Gemmataceae bacterium]
MSRAMRVGAVEYLNTRPLIYELDRILPDAEIILDVPSRLAQALAADQVDVAIIPAIEYFRVGRYSIVPDIAIASRGPVLSVTLFSRVPWQEIRRVAVDEGSRTSAALAEVLLRCRYRTEPETISLPLDAVAEEADVDAVLLIGDRAMRACLPGFTYAYDLGREWDDWTGLPFVYAVWAVRPGVDALRLTLALQESKRRGLQAIGSIAQREAKRLGLDAGFCRRYLQSIIYFDLGPQEIRGLKRFVKLCAELGLAPASSQIRFVPTPAE